MVIPSYKELAEAKARVSKLESAWNKELNSRLAGLPSEFGFESLDAFIDALRGASGKGGRRGAKKSASSAPRAAASSSASTGSRRKRRKRATITPETKETVKKLVSDGRTGAQIAKELGISLPSVQNIKKELGLVKARK